MTEVDYNKKITLGEVDKAISKLLKEFANMPIADRGHGGDWLMMLRYRLKEEFKEELRKEMDKRAKGSQ